MYMICVAWCSKDDPIGCAALGMVCWLVGCMLRCSLTKAERVLLEGFARTHSQVVVYAATYLGAKVHLNVSLRA